jgi:chromate reductase
MPNIAVIVGSLRRDSHNRKLAEALARLAKPKAQLALSRIDDLPLFNEDLEPSPPAAVPRLKREIEAADGVLIVTPEYNRSIPGVLKNAVDWASRPYGKNSFAGKPGASIGVSIGTIGSGPAAPAQHPAPPRRRADEPAGGVRHVQARLLRRRWQHCRRKRPPVPAWLCGIARGLG